MNTLSFATPRTLRPAARMLVLLALIAMIAGCGKKGPVRPRLATLPQAPSAVTLHQQGRLFLLSWAIPTYNQDGSAVEDLSGFFVRRLVYDAVEGCPTCRDPQTVVAEIDLRHPKPAQQIGGRIYWRDVDIQPGRGYRYAIAPRTIGGADAPAATAHLAAVPPLPPPAHFTVEAGDAQVALQWDAAALPAGAELLGYNLYRRHAERAFPILPVNRKPLQETRLLDRGLVNGQAYEYRVSALVRVGEQQLESMASPGALITPQK